MNEDNEKWQLPPQLRITDPKVAEEAAKMQEQLEQRIASPFARLSPEEFAVARAHQRIKFLSHSLEMIGQSLAQTRGRNETAQLKEAQGAIATRLAEALATTGQLSLAAQIHPDKAHREEYQKQIEENRKKRPFDTL